MCRGWERRAESVHFPFLVQISALDLTREPFADQAEAQLCFASVTGGEGYRRGKRLSEAPVLSGGLCGTCTCGRKMR